MIPKGKKKTEALLEKEGEEKDHKEEEKRKIKIKRERNLQFETEDILRTDIKTYLFYVIPKIMLFCSAFIPNSSSCSGPRIF